ncbi:heterokaryon incompatibility protein-domain-containing protein [Scleroderma citrinum]
MRLISVSAVLERERSMEYWWWRTNPQIEVMKDDGNGKTEYAILSHRWGDEVNYNEMVDLTKLKNRDKIRRRDGYQKILNTCKQAKLDCIEWLWVDTCCIDKRNGSEVSEAINSMYRWYENSKICYAYLHDVEDQFFPTRNDSNKFPRSNGWPEWFSRGWTLQELIAPRNLQFFNKYWKSIGDKAAHAYDLTNITQVPVDILVHGLTTNRPCVAQIMSWAADRKTTRVEDHAYSLLGLLDVNMTMLYGEGKNAFQRLQLEIIRKLNDQSILAWDPDGMIRWTGSVLADNPSFFRDCHDIEKMEPDAYIIHMQESLPEAKAHSVALTDERLGAFSINNRVFSRVTLACRRRWDPRPVTIDLAFWMSNYWRYLGTTKIPKGLPQLRKLCVSYQSEVYPNYTFDGLDEIQNTLISRGFTYRGSFPHTIPNNSTSLTLSGTNELVVTVYEKEESERVRLAVVYGYSLGREWVRVTQANCEVETWKEYADTVYVQMWTAGSDHISHSRDSNINHVHLIWPEWSGWAVRLIRTRRERSSEPMSRSAIVELYHCGDDNCGAQQGWGDIKRTSDAIRILAQLTKRLPNLNRQVDRNPIKIGMHMDHIYYRGTLFPGGKHVRIQSRQERYTEEMDAFHEPYIWSLLDHKNIHPFLGIVTTLDCTVSTVVEWVDKGDAHSYARDLQVDPSFLVCPGIYYCPPAFPLHLNFSSLGLPVRCIISIPIRWAQ